ncbi:MAG TPA: M23 family metallopeptidase, partial [Miltoncostaea sp.]|nr:M23 family metallopeptidase [Miltoncostaea sp.]
DAVRMTVRASDGPGGSSAGITAGSVSGLTVDGSPVAAGQGSRVEVPGIGTLVFLEEAPDGVGAVQANALRIEVTDASAAALIGQPFVLGHVELKTAEGAPAAPEAPATTAPGTTTAPARTATDEAPVTAPALQPAPSLGLPRRPAPAVAIPANAGYVFPVAGGASFTDDYGAARADTGWHHGNDLFADRGTPVVAVADGTLSKVGINALGGNRLWLTDDRGNAFYYAHLSAYAPEALEGARVHAGQVIGFVGNTGDAITTPPHLHFEVHPGDGDSVDPYPYLLAWQRGTDVSRSFAQAAVSTSPVPAVGAVLIDQVPERDAPADQGDGLAVPVT